jgi:hypothetical protein
MSKSCVGVLVLAAAGALGASVCGVSVARAQGVPDPAFGFEKPPGKPVDWKVQAKAGGMLTTGNAQSKVITAALDASRQSGENKISLNGTVAYGTSNNTFVPVPSAGDPTMVDGLARTSTTSTNEWKARGRYDRFLTPNNSAYGAGLIGANKVAGKRLYGGGQVGYSRQLVKNERHTLVAELGYDFSYESYVPVPGKSLDGVSIHSARVFAGELWSLSKDTGINVSAEALFNLNKETGALDSSTGLAGVDALAWRSGSPGGTTRTRRPSRHPRCPWGSPTSPTSSPSPRAATRSRRSLSSIRSCSRPRIRPRPRPAID